MFVRKVTDSRPRTVDQGWYEDGTRGCRLASNHTHPSSRLTQLMSVMMLNIGM